MGWKWGGKPGCRRKNDCATAAVTQRNVRREHRRDPSHSSAWGVSGFPDPGGFLLLIQ